MWRRGNGWRRAREMMGDGERGGEGEGREKEEGWHGEVEGCPGDGQRMLCSHLQLEPVTASHVTPILCYRKYNYPLVGR